MTDEKTTRAPQEGQLTLEEVVTPETQDAQQAAQITFSTDADPALDPTSPDFNRERWLRELSSEEWRERMNEAVTRLQQLVISISAAQHNAGEIVDAAAQQTISQAQQTMKNIAEFVNSDRYKTIKEAIHSLSTFLEEHRAELDAAAEAAGVDDVSEDIAVIESIVARPPQDLAFPLDKINSTVWEALNNAGPNGQITMMPFATEKRGSSKEATVYLSMDFAKVETELKELGVELNLTPFDKRVYIAVNGLFHSQSGFMSEEQIWGAMGNSSRPNAKQLEKVHKSLTKMGAHIFIDNTNELPINKKYDRFVYDGDILPFERVSAYINNRLSASVIHVFREPPLMSFAKSRRQITSVSRAVLESPISKTDENLRIDDYLIERIAHIKKGNLSNKILFKTIFEKCDITEKKQKQRAKDKISRYLAHYAKTGFIKGYDLAPDGIIIKYKK